MARSKRAFLVESLETRNLLAGDLFDSAVFASSPDSNRDVVEASQTAPLSADGGLAAVATASAAGQKAEGESQPDLVAFAKALTAAGVKYYSAAWCPHCNAQKDLFEDGRNFLPSIEVTNPDRTLNAIGIANNITSFPTWEYLNRPNAAEPTRLTGTQTLAKLSEWTGIAIPASETPFIKPIDDATLLGGSPLHLPLDGYDPNGGTLTYTITSDNPSLVAPTLLQGNRSMRIEVNGWGSMVFQLFEDKAPRPTGRVISLAQSNFYNGIIFHRVIEDFVIQGGDPTGTGTGGSTLGDFDDQFHVDLQHNRDGLLSYAKSTDDTNDSQFFVTLAATRHLDFNHSVFGILTEGFDVLHAIGNTATDSSDRPTQDIVINSVTIFNDAENGVLMLKAAEGASGQANVTVTATDAQGHSVQDTFLVTVKPDTTANGGANGGPFLQDIAPLTTSAGTPVNLQLAAVDVEGDAVYYDANAVANANYTVNVNHDTGLVTVTPNAGFFGTTEVIVAVRAVNGSNTGDTWDRQSVQLTVLPGTPTLDLLEAGDSNIPTDNVTNITNLPFRVSNVVTGATVQILRGDTVIGQGTANGTTIDITTNNLAALGDGVYSLTAVQIASSLRSPTSAPVQVALDTTPPPAFTSTAPATAVAGQPLTYDAQNPAEGTAGFTYSLVGGPTGATIVPATGVLSWTPTTDQGGANLFQIRGMDLAGNSVTQDLSVDVSTVTQEIRVRLAATDLSGTPLTTASVGQEFLVQVYVRDIRPNAKGVFAAYLDVTYPANLVSVADTTIVYGDPYENGKSGSLSVAGLIDEAGAFGGFTQTGAGEKLLFSVKMKADQAGQVPIVGNPADDVGHQILVYDSDDPIAWDAVTILPTTLAVTAGVTAVNDLYNVDEDSTGTTLNVLSNDLNELSGALIISAVGSTNHGGTVTIAANGLSLNYRPAANYFGEEQFTYTVRNGDVTAVGTVTVQVQPVNDPPTAANDPFTVGADTQANFLNVLTNDGISPDQDETLRVTAVGTTSQGGTVTIAPNGTHLLYTPKAGFGGQETFTYTISDRTTGGLTATATVTVTVESGPLPTATADTATLAEDAAQTVINVLANDTPGETGGVLTVTAVGASANGGTVAIGTNGANVLYKPDANFNGTDTFTYTVKEEGGRSATATVTVTVTSVNDPPTAANDTYDVPKDSAVKTLDVLANDSIAPDAGETLTITAVTQGTQNGTVLLAADSRSVTYKPADGYKGDETFTYTISDGNGGTATATVTIHVLEYTPRSVSGNVMTTRAALGGMKIDLTGTDEFAKPVTLSTLSEADGTFVFHDLAPGSYSLYAIQSGAPKFLIDQPNALTIQSGFESGNSTGNNFELPGRQAKFMTVADFLVTAPGQSSRSPANSLTVAVEPGQTQQWYSISAGWTGYRDLSIQLSTNKAQITLTATNSQNQQFSGTLNAGDTNLVKWLGSEGTAYLLRIDASPAQFGLQPVAGGASSTTDGSGEGESSTFLETAVVTQAAAADESRQVPVSPVAASGSPAVSTTLASDAVTVLDVVVPDAGVAQTQVASSVAPAATVAGAGWFAVPLDASLASGAEAELVTVTVQAGESAAAAVDAVMTLGDFSAQVTVQEEQIPDELADEDEYASVVDTLMTEESGALADWV